MLSLGIGAPASIAQSLLFGFGETEQGESEIVVTATAAAGLDAFQSANAVVGDAIHGVGMSVGHTAIECYQNEDVIVDFTVSDTSVATIAGWTIALKIKELASDPDPALVGPVTCSISGTLTFRASFNMDVPPGLYAYGVRRTNGGTAWELAVGTVTVLDTPSSDVSP